jgi:hypothetical protein
VRLQFTDHTDANDYFASNPHLNARQLTCGGLERGSRAFPHDTYEIDGARYFVTRDNAAITLHALSK